MPLAVATVDPGGALRIAIPGGDGWAVGGNFYLTDNFGEQVSGLVKVSLSDGTLFEFACPDGTGERPFAGFITGSAITWVEFSGPAWVDFSKPTFATLANLYAARNPVAFAPTVTMAYSSVPAWLGGVGTFQANTTGRPPFDYQLMKNGVLVDSGTNALLVVTNVQAADLASDFSIRVTNYFGSAMVSNLSLYPTTVAAWGWNEYGQCHTPPGLTNMVQVAGGLWHTLGLQAGGTVAAWGRNTAGQTNVPAGLTNVIAVAAGWHHSLALCGGGTVVAWGDNAVGQTNVPPGLNNAIAVAAGNYHNLALQTNGTVVAWGRNWEGQTNVPPDLTNVVAVACGGSHSLALRANGTVVTWGLNGEGQTNVPPSLTNVVAVAGGGNHSLALRANGTVVAWGRNWDGQATVPAGLTNVVAVAAGAYHSLALQADGTVVAWGINWLGQTTLPPGLTNALSVASGYGNSLALVDSGPLARQALAQNPTRTQSGFSLQIPTQSGYVYRLEYKDTLPATTWVPFPLVPGNGGIQTLTDPSASSAARFYRVRSW